MKSKSNQNWCTMQTQATSSLAHLFFSRKLLWLIFPTAASIIFPLNQSIMRFLPLGQICWILGPSAPYHYPTSSTDIRTNPQLIVEAFRKCLSDSTPLLISKAALGIQGLAESMELLGVEDGAKISANATVEYDGTEGETNYTAKDAGLIDDTESKGW